MQNQGYQSNSDVAGSRYGVKMPGAQPQQPGAQEQPVQPGVQPHAAWQQPYQASQAPYQAPPQSSAQQPASQQYAPQYAQPQPGAYYAQNPGQHQGVQQPGQQQYAVPVTSQPQQPVGGQEPARKKKRGIGFWIGIIAAIVAIALAAFFAYQYLGPGHSARNAAGAYGQLEGKTPEEIQAELNKMVEEGMLNINILSTIEMENGDAPAVMRIENSPANHYMFNVVITDNETGETYYESGMLEPNYHIEQDNLQVHLDKGTYPCTATFYAYDMETEDPIGEAAAMVTIEVKN